MPALTTPEVLNSIQLWSGVHETAPQSFDLFLVESKPVYWRKLFYQCDLAQPCALVLSAAECSIIVSHPSKVGLQMMNTAILVLLCYYNSATGIQGCFSKKFTQSVIESVFQSVLCFSHVPPQYTAS